MARRYRRQEATVAADETDNPLYNNISTASSDNSTGSWHSSCSSVTSIRFGNVNIREYERKLDPNADVDLGLTLGWRYNEHQPQHLDKVHKDDNNHNTDNREFLYGETTTNPMTEMERAEILLASGYSKRQLRSALHKQHEGDPKIPATLQSRLGTMARSLKRGVKAVLYKLY